MQESLYADNAIPSSSNRPRSYTCRLCGKARHNGRTCNAPSIDYQMKGVPSLVAELAQGVPVVPVPFVVTDVDEFPPNATEFTDRELTALQDVDFISCAADGEEIGFFPTCLPACLPSFLPSCLPSFIPSFRPSFLPSVLPSFLPSFLISIILSFFFPSFLRSFFPSFLLTFLPSFLPFFLPSLPQLP